MSYMSEMLAEFERGEYRQLKGVALASLECQVSGHQDAFDQSFAEAATPGVIWKLVGRHQALLVELEKLKAENEALVNRIENVCRVAGIKQGTLLTGVEALRKDAERYRWLRDKSESVHPFYLSVPIWVTGVRFRKEDVDSSIDTAMAKERGQ